MTKPHAVAGRGRITPAGYQPENAEHARILIALDEKGRRIGRNPLDDLTPAQLTAAGHPRAYAANVVARMNRSGGHDDDARGVRLTTLRDRYCLPCQENMAEIRRCIVIDCPCWPYRMGRNPHNPQRGNNPWAETSILARGDTRGE